MSRTRKKHARPTKFTLLTQEIESIEADARHFEKICLTTTDPHEKRRCYIRMQEYKSKLQQKRTQLRKLKRRCKPAEAVPLFKFDGKELD